MVGCPHPVCAALTKCGDVDLNYEFDAARLPLVEPSGVNTESTTSSTFTGDSASFAHRHPGNNTTVVQVYILNRSMKHSSGGTCVDILGHICLFA